MLLVLYDVQIYMRMEVTPKYSIDIWIDNVEVLAHEQRGEKVNNIKDHLVLDYDLLREMDCLQGKILIPIKWNKVNSHINIRTYRRDRNHRGVHER